MGAGLLTLGGYLLVLFALSRAAVAVVGPLRESAILITAAWGVLVLHEAVDPTRDRAAARGFGHGARGAAVLALAG